MKLAPKARYYTLGPEVARAIQQGLPIVALESTVITHGLPRPLNLELARQMETEVRAQAAIPATIALLDQKVHVGLTEVELERLANEPAARKVSRRDFGAALAQGAVGGTTVAGTLIAAHMVGIKVFATGGIGGVHRDAPFDISADLPELARTPVIVVCAGAKAILDLPATLEYLETAGVPVIGYGTRDFPAFYSRCSGLSVPITAQTPAEIAEIARAHWAVGLQSALLVVQPPPEADALPAEIVEAAIEKALAEAKAQNIHGAATTPFLLSRVSTLTEGASLKSNLALLRNNARLAGQIAREMATPRRQQEA